VAFAAEVADAEEVRKVRWRRVNPRQDRRRRPAAVRLVGDVERPSPADRDAAKNREGMRGVPRGGVRAAVDPLAYALIRVARLSQRYAGYPDLPAHRDADAAPPDAVERGEAGPRRVACHA